MMGLESSIMSWSAFWIRQKQSNFGESETGAALKVKSPCNLDDGKKKTQNTRTNDIPKNRESAKK